MKSICFVNSEDPDEILHSTVFHLGFHCLSKSAWVHVQYCILLYCILRIWSVSSTKYILYKGGYHPTPNVIKYALSVLNYKINIFRYKPTHKAYSKSVETGKVQSSL